MAGKLTPEQKALNKEATKLRDAAFKERRRAYQAEIEAAKASVESSELGKAANEAYAALESLFDARNAAISEIDEQIRLLQEKKLLITKEHRELIEVSKAKRDETYKAKHSAVLAAEESVKAKYPDMVDCYSSGGWKSIDEFLPLVKK